MSYEKFPDYGDRPLLDNSRVLSVIIYPAIIAVIVWLVRWYGTTNFINET
jgi:hypothetical protein